MPTSKIESAPTKSEKAPKGGKSVSERTSEAEDDGPIFDFLFHDARRIASFQAQFHVYGVATGVSAVEAVTETERTTTGVEARGGIPALVEGGASNLTETGTKETDSAEWQYDPLWQNALKFMRDIARRGLVQTDISKAAIGQFVLCSGELSFSDLPLMQKAWSLDSFRNRMRDGLKDDLKTKINPKDRGAFRDALQQSMEGLELFWEMLSILPHTIQAKISGQQEIWFSLHQEGLSVSASDIALKYGAKIPGTWSVLGILDTRPDRMQSVTAPPPTFEDDSEMAAKMMEVIAPLARRLLGRAERCFGVTPLLVFREVAR